MAERGYIITWLWHSKIEGPEHIPKQGIEVPKSISPTGYLVPTFAMVICLARTLCTVHLARIDEGRTPLLWAALRGEEAVVKLLVERDDVAANSKDNEGWTPLWWAVANGDEGMVKLLLKRDDVVADSNDNRGQTPLSLAAVEGHEAAVKLLVERDDVMADSKDIYGRTPLSWAAAVLEYRQRVL
jgi:ankyrin repeat protein